jgi:hypothetical protein
MLPVPHQVIVQTRRQIPGAIEAEFVLAEGVRFDTARLRELLSNFPGNAVTRGAADTPIQARNACEPAASGAQRLCQAFRDETQPGKQGFGPGL